MDGAGLFSKRPELKLDWRFETESNLFAKMFGMLSIEQWSKLLIRSIQEQEIDGIPFPTFPSSEIQANIHGHDGVTSILEAVDFYRFITNLTDTGQHRRFSSDEYMLDFGAGWGRITRVFMRDYPLRNIFGYEPNGVYSSLARFHNPWLTFISGGYLPDGVLPASKFNLICGWSVFSHLSQSAVRGWLAEFARILAPGGRAVMTTWGERYLRRLQAEQFQQARGEPIHWYSAACLKDAGDLEERIQQYRRGEFIWIGPETELYGQTFLSEPTLQAMINEANLPLSIERFDVTALSQDVFVLKRV
jgi:SAM-dependent methyltransferase